MQVSCQGFWHSGGGCKGPHVKIKNARCEHAAELSCPGAQGAMVIRPPHRKRGTQQQRLLRRVGQPDIPQAKHNCLEAARAPLCDQIISQVHEGHSSAGSLGMQPYMK